MAEGEGKGKKVYLIDAMSFVFRAYHAPMPLRLASASGTPTQAVFLFNNMLRKLLREHGPDYVAVVFDSRGPTVRDALFKEYKAQRPSMPDDLAAQLPFIRQLCEALRLACLEYPGYEADDIIGTLALRAAEQGLESVIVTSDKDMFQLVQTMTPPPIRVFSPTREKFFDEAAVEDYFGVPPGKVLDVVALMGDAVDNIPGAKGIGEKGARDLILRFGSVEEAMAHAAEVKHKKYREALEQQQDQILLSKQLAKLHTDLPVPLELDRLALREPDDEGLVALYGELGFTSLLKDQMAASTAVAPTETKYKEFPTPKDLQEFLSRPRSSPLAIWAEAVGNEPLDLQWNSLGVATAPGEAWQLSLGGERSAWLKVLRDYLEDPKQPKTVHDAKAMALALATEGLAAAGIQHDTALYSYLVQPTTSKHTLEDVAARRLNRPLSGSVAEKADFVARLNAPLREEVEGQGLLRVYEAVELPLGPVLADMERTGVRLDPGALEALAATCEKEINALTEEIYRLAGTEFNPNSPKQLGEILFEKLQLQPPRRRGKAKAASTAADVLEELAAQHDLPARVLDYRELQKLKSTYIDVLPTKIHPRTGRLHTSFHQAGTATGRLSSSDPNLQNIPIRGELAKAIRAAFVPEPGWRLLGGDYSQIELRVLAHMSDDPVLVAAFERQEDIHARTAEEVLGIPPLMQNSEHRRVAKMINFGIIYGLTAYGLATRLRIEPREAQRYIDAYFKRYAGVRKFREELLREVRETGVARTLFGRARPIPEINSQNPAQRNFAERTALNSPLQGTAADLIKLAMVRAHERLRAEGRRTRMILQVHDELLFEAPAEEAELVQVLVKETMEQVALPGGERVKLRVPLTVEVGSGSNWAELK